MDVEETGLAGVATTIPFLSNSSQGPPFLGGPAALQAFPVLQ